MKIRAGIVCLYGLLLLIGGMIGYLKAGSMASLIMGGAFALLTIASALAIGKNYKLGYYSALILSVILTLFFTFRFVKSENFMPSGLMAALSLIVIMVLLSKPCKQCSLRQSSCSAKKPSEKD
jgi:uncharacterized membrane protein (UPF0136 family)